MHSKYQIRRRRRKKKKKTKNKNKEGNFYLNNGECHNHLLVGIEFRDFIYSSANWNLLISVYEPHAIKIITSCSTIGLVHA